MGEMTKNYLKQAPLSFVGQKRNFVKHYVKVLNENIPGDGEGWTIVDAFGGSGLLSHVSKRIKPKARVIYNDFDNYAERIANIESTERLRVKLLDCYDKECANKRLQKHHEDKICEVLSSHVGFIDWEVVCRWVFFSGSDVLKSSEKIKHKGQMWGRVRKSPLNVEAAKTYLDGVEIVKADFRCLMDKYKGDNKALLVLDPPYLCTAQATYKNERYFDLIDFLELCDRVRAPYCLFSSTKSELNRFVEYAEQSNKYKELQQPARLTVKGTLNYCNHYEDNLLYKF